MKEEYEISRKVINNCRNLSKDVYDVLFFVLHTVLIWFYVQSKRTYPF